MPWVGEACARNHSAKGGSVAEWYVIQCRAGQEYQISVILHDAIGLNMFIPKVQDHRAGRHYELILFPGYLFVELETNDRAISLIGSIPGVVRIVGYGGIPQPISAATIENLREYIAMVNSHGGLRNYALRPGDRVKIGHGPLRGLEAVFQCSLDAGERVKVLISFLGRMCNVEVAAEDLEGPAVPPLRRRTTRGRGRRLASARG